MFVRTVWTVSSIVWALSRQVVWNAALDVLLTVESGDMSTSKRALNTFRPMSQRAMTISSAETTPSMMVLSSHNRTIPISYRLSPRD